MIEKNQGPGPGENKMGHMPVGRLLIHMALPIVISMLVQAMYNVVDSIFISRISESAVTALSLAFPVQNLQIGFALGVGVGVNSMLSKSLGQGNMDMANHTAGSGIFLMLVSVALFMVFGIFGVRPYYEMQSTVAETVENGIVYTAICCIGTLGIFVEILGERLLQSTGRTFYTMITQGVGAIVNIILDPILIFGWFGLPRMGVAGAAVATVIGQWLAAALAVVFNLLRNPEVQFGLSYIRPRKAAVLPILEVGIPSVIMTSIGSIMTFGMNQILQGFQETATSVFGIYFKLQSFFFMPVFGLNNAAISIVAYNYGARKPERITATLKCCCAIAMGVMVAGLLSFQIFPDVLLGIFKPSEEFLRIGRGALRIISLSFPAAAIGIVLSSCFQAMGNGSYSAIQSLCRQLVVLLPAAWLLSKTGDVNAVWWSFPIAEVASLLVTLLLFARIYRCKVKPMRV